MEEALLAAIDGGWKPDQKAQFWIINGQHIQVGDHLALDPLFWQSLGKALGWETRPNGLDWKWVCHRFVDHLIGGKDADSFFKKLLKDQSDE